jgi:predicted permease
MPSAEYDSTLVDWQARSDLFQSVAAFTSPGQLPVADDSSPLTISVGLVSRSFFTVLGLPAPTSWTAVARGETPVVLSDAVAGRLAGRPIGRLLTTATGQNLRVVGVLPSGFVFPQEPTRRAITALMPLSDEHIVQLHRVGGAYTGYTLTLLARVQSGVPPQALGPALNAMASAGQVGWRVRPLREVVVGEVTPLALGAVAAASLVLLMATANVGGLLVTRWTYRATGCAMRSALGARPVDLIRLLLCDVGWLSCLGLVGGLAVTSGVLSLAATVIPPQYAAFGVPGLDGQVASYAIELTFIVAGLALVPVAIAARLAGRGAWGAVPTTTLTPSTGVRFWLTAIQSAVSGVLIVGAILLARSYLNLMTQDTGFGSHAIEVSAIYPSDESPAVLVNTVRETVRRLSGVPGVVHVGATQGPLANGLMSGGTGIVMNGRRLAAMTSGVTGEYFSATGMKLIAGRAPRPGERTVAVINHSLANLCCAGSSAVGTVFTRGTEEVEVVGVADDSFDVSLDRRPTPRTYEPMKIPAVSAGGIAINYVLDVGTGDLSVPPRAARIIWTTDRSAQVVSAGSLNSMLWATVRNRTFATLVLVLFAAASLGISLAGTAGVVGFTVARRTHEIGLIVALGATPRNVRWTVTRDAAAAATLGLTIGIGAGALASKGFVSLLYGIAPADPVSVATAAALMFSAIALAALAAAQRAVSLSPAEALRVD